MYICVCVGRERVRTGLVTRTLLKMNNYLGATFPQYIYIYTFTHVCLGGGERERENQ
jgi:hypothetical protein